MPPALFSAMLLLLLGAMLGSFAATVLIRAPMGDWALAGRSRCDSCGHGLHAVELVPLISALWLRGRCRICRARIPFAHAFTEWMCAALGAGLGLAFPFIQALTLLLLAVQLLLLAMLDQRHLWLPNRLTGLLAVSGLLLGGIATGASLPDRLIGLAIGFGMLSAVRLAYRRLRGREGMGGGDPKLAGAILAWTGWPAFPALLISASAIGILWGVCSVLFGGRKERRMQFVQVPFGVALALACPIAIFAEHADFQPGLWRTVAASPGV